MMHAAPIQSPKGDPADRLEFALRVELRTSEERATDAAILAASTKDKAHLVTSIATARAADRLRVALARYIARDVDPIETIERWRPRADLAAMTTARAELLSRVRVALDAI